MRLHHGKVVAGTARQQRGHTAAALQWRQVPASNAAPSAHGAAQRMRHARAER